jgi:hypothetical protein
LPNAAFLPIEPVADADRRGYYTFCTARAPILTSPGKSRKRLRDYFRSRPLGRAPCPLAHQKAARSRPTIDSLCQNGQKRRKLFLCTGRCPH